MSWSLYLFGKPVPLAAKAAEDFAKITLSIPEEQAIKDKAADVVATLLASYNTDTIVKLEASGSCLKSQDPKDPTAPAKLTHNLSIKVEQVYGFLAE